MKDFLLRRKIQILVYYWKNTELRIKHQETK